MTCLPPAVPSIQGSRSGKRSRSIGNREPGDRAARPAQAPTSLLTMTASASWQRCGRIEALLDGLGKMTACYGMILPTRKEETFLSKQWPFTLAATIVCIVGAALQAFGPYYGISKYVGLSL